MNQAEYRYLLERRKVTLIAPACISRPVNYVSRPAMPSCAVHAQSVSHTLTHSSLTPVLQKTRLGVAKAASIGSDFPIRTPSGGINWQWLESSIETSRASPHKPTIAIIDVFDELYVDVNGDGKLDISHGDLVAAVLQSHLDCKVLKFEGSHVYLFSHLIIRQVKKILEYHVNQEPIDAVNISIGKDVKIDDLARFTKTPGLSAENVHEYQEKLRRHYLNTNDFLQGEVIEALESLTSQGIKVFVAGGNMGPDYINIYSLARDVISVGNTNACGTIQARSARNSLLRYEQGTFSVSLTHDGYSLFGSDRADVTFDKVPQRTWWSRSYPERFVGRSAEHVICRDHQSYLDKIDWASSKEKPKLGWFSSMRSKLYSLETLKSMGAMSEAEFKSLVECGFVLCSFDNKYYFGIDQNSRVTYDPAASGSKNIIHHVAGTSYSVPLAIAKTFRN